MKIRPIKVLLIRFSSFGDITQCLSVPSRLKELGSGVQVHWITRSEFTPLLQGHPAIDHIWSFGRSDGFVGLLRLIWRLRQEHYSHVYDAHNNLRSHLISLLLNPPELLRKSQKRWKRILLFRFRKNLYEQPFSGQRDLLEPLTEWGLGKTLPATPQLFVAKSASESALKILAAWSLKPFVAVAASAAHELKRWPLASWKTLLKRTPMNFVLLGGPEDHFLAELAAVAPERILNLAGKTNFQESAAVVSQSQLLLANDTGLLHVAEQLGKSCIALMGPAPFGFPSRPSTRVLQLDLACRPCSKHGQGPCTNPQFHQCLVDISPEQVQRELEKLVTLG